MDLGTTGPIDCYLRRTDLVDFDHPLIQDYLRSNPSTGCSEEEIVKETFEFVRDDIAHSWDIQSDRVTAKASDVLKYREGICYAKSHLLAALLRGMGIPTGFCYQKLVLSDKPEDGYAVHGLNTVYLRGADKWIRLDARGNKPGVDAQFSIYEERLAFPVRAEMGEVDYLINHADPHPKIIECLTQREKASEMYRCGLPAEL
ncbi:MAG TPA: transglutaminase family protein [Capsulimonadaceae bacterium]|nr:transglutaminase family protein [Capsulimonadaceae bacterium]